MELISLQYFKAAVEQKSFTKAARLTYTSQSNISKQISKLEEELGVSLFARSSSGIQLTAAGQTLYEGLAMILPALDSLIEKTQKAQMESEKPILTVGIAEGLDIEQVIPGFFILVNKEFPGLDLRIQVHPFDRLSEKLSREELDCIFLFNVVRLDDRFIRIPLTRKNPLLYFSKNHPLGQKSNVNVMDFEHETFISTGKYGDYDEFEMLPFRPQRVITSNSPTAAFQYVSAGVGVAVLGQSQSNKTRETICSIELPTDQKVGTDLVYLRGHKKTVIETFTQLMLNASNC